MTASKMTMRAAREWGGFIIGAMLIWLTLASMARAEDVTTLSGATYREVRLVRVEPDGVTWEHSTGVVKVDFSDLPEPVRKAYHYDSGKAAAFQAGQAKAREDFAARMQQAQHDAETHRVQQYQAQTATAPAAEGQPGEFVARRKAADAALVKSANEGIAAKKEAELLRTKDDGTIYDRRLWAIPRLLTGGYSDGTDFDPKTDLNSREVQSDQHSGGDAFFNPSYMTKSYNDEVDRAAAFARDKP